MGKIFVTSSSKGGVGKTLTTLSLCQVASLKGLDFEYIEIDNSNNTSISLSNSKTFKNKMLSVATLKAQEELLKACWKALKQGKLIFIDVGGGSDTVEVINLIKDEFSHNDICYLLPFENSLKQMGNLINTYSLIDNPEKTYLIKNKVLRGKEKDAFRFFEGDKALGIKSIRKELNSPNKVFEIYLSDSQQLPEVTQECMLDLASLAMEYARVEADRNFTESSKDMQEYVFMMQEYTKSEMCLKEITSIAEEFKELFEEEVSND